MRDLPQPPTLLPGGKLPGQILVVESIYHVRPESQPDGVESRYSRWLKTNDSRFIDELTANSEWQEVSTGRLKDVGMMVLHNHAGEDLQVVPTPEERKRIQGLVVEIFLAISGTTPPNDTETGHTVPHLIFSPGETARFQPGRGVKVFLRCLTGEAPCVITSFPG